MKTILHLQHLQDQECHCHLLSLWCVENLMRCYWSPLDHSKILLHSMVLTAVNPSWRQCFGMGKGRNTGDSACQVSHGYKGVYLELDLQTTHFHPVVLLGSFPWRTLCCHLKHWWEMGLQWVWGMTGWHSLWCTENETSASLELQLVIVAEVLAVLSAGFHRTLIIWAGEHQLVVGDAASSVSARWGLCMLLWSCWWVFKVHRVEGWISSCGDMVDLQCSAKRVGDIEAFTPTLITIIFLYKLSCRSIIQGGHKATEECFLW